MLDYDVVVVGGGLSGLGSAYFLSKNGFNVLLLEKDTELGGLCRSYDLGNYSIERFYHHAIPYYKTFLEILDELKIGNLLEWKNASLGFYLNEKTHVADNLINMLFFPLSFPDKIKMASLLLKIKLTKDVSRLDNVKVKDWLIKAGGNNLYKSFFLPLLKGKYGETFEKASAAWFLERIKLRSTRSFGGEKLGYMKYGFRSLIEKLEEKILKNGKIYTNTSVENIKRAGNEFIISTQKRKFRSKNVIFTASAKELLKMCNLPKDYSDNLQKINYQGTLCVLFSLKNQLQNVYWLNFISGNLSFVALIEHTNFHNIPEYNNEHLVYIPIYVQNQSDPLWKKDDKYVVNMLINDLKKIFPNFNENDINWWKIERDKYTAPIYNLGYMKNIPEIKTPIKGLYLGGLALSYPERTMDSALIIGKKCAMEIIKGD